MTIHSTTPGARAGRTLTLALALAGAAAAPPLAASAAAQNGLTFGYRVQSAAGARRAGGEPAPDMVATVRIAGTNARMDFREGGTPMTKEGGYILIRGADKTMVLVNAKDRQAMIVGAEGLGTAAGAMTNNAMVKVATRDQRFAFEDLGPGERILGYPTRRVRTTWGGATEVRVLGRKSTTTESSSSESWIATRIEGADAEALRGWSKAFGAGIRRFNPDLARQMTDYERQFGNGLALRSVVVTTSTDDKGKTVTDTVRMEVTELSRARLDPSIFEVPKDYAVADMREMGAAMDSLSRATSASIDSARRASGADTVTAGGVAREAGKDAAADAVRAKLGGLLRKKKP